MDQEISTSVTVVTKFSTRGFTDNGTLLSKRITLGADGKPSSDGSACHLERGSAITVPAPTAAIIAHIIEGLGSHQALVLGELKVGTKSRRSVVTQRVLDTLPEAQRQTTIARTREHIAYQPGKPGWMMIDYDSKGMPPAVAANVESSGGVWPALLTVAPGLSAASRVSRASTSAGLRNALTGETFLSSGGEHHYILARDGGDVDRALRDLRDRCWLHDLGWLLVGASGHLLLRSAIDAMVGGGERLCFEGKPEVLPPLEQDLAIRAPRAFEGEAIDTRKVIPPLTPHERGLVQDKQAAARRELEPAAQVVRAAADNALLAELRKVHPEAVARRIVVQRHDRKLLPDIVLDFDHHGLVRVGDVLADPDKFVGETLADPFEGVAYGRDKAKVLRGRDGGLIIHSFAHGQTIYRLRHDLASALQVLAKADKAAILAVMCELDAASDLEVDETQQMIAEAARMSGHGVRVVAKRLTDARRARDQKRRKERAEREANLDAGHRLVRPAPPFDGRRTEVVEEIDEALAANATDQPPMRDRTGALVEVRVQTTRSLHELTSQSANAEPLPEGVEPLPAPPEPLLVQLTDTEVELLIETYFNWFRFDRDQRRYDAALPSPFIDALMVWPRSTMPVVQALNTAPLILPNGEVLTGSGLDRTNGLYHHIEPGLQACVPQGLVTQQAAREAVKWLCGEWLCDVLTDEIGKLTTLLYAETCLQRTLLPERPGFLITAGRRGGGKSTLCHMVSMAIFGRRAPAASWSPHEEERRKSLFSYLRAGIASLVWDNVLNGSVINSEIVNRALTGETVSDRILGIMKHAVVDATMIQAWTGNLITPGGDFTRRARRIHLDTDMPRPEDRKVRHQDPVGWTEQHRSEILRCLYTILIHAGQHRPANQVPVTGMKTWWRLVGYSAEVVGPLLEPAVAFSCVVEDKKLDVVDTEAEAVVTVLRLVRDVFGSAEFTASDIARKIEAATDFNVGFDVQAVSGKSAEEIAASDAEKAADKAAGTAFAEALKELASPRKPALTSKGIGRLLTTTMVDQGHFLDADLTTSGSLKWLIDRDGLKHFQLKVTDEAPKLHTSSGYAATNYPPNKSANPAHNAGTGSDVPREGESADFADLFGGESAKLIDLNLCVIPNTEDTNPGGNTLALDAGEPASEPDTKTRTSPGVAPADYQPGNPANSAGQVEEAIRDIARANPTWSPDRIAQRLGLDVAHVTKVLLRGDLP